MSSATKDELREALHAVEKSNDEWRLTTRELYANAESDRMQNNDRFAKMQDKIHDTHLSLITQVNTAATAANAASAAAAAVLASTAKK